MQTIQIIGYLGKDAEIREFTGNPFVTFSVAVTRQSKNAEPRTTWYYCTRSYKEGSELAKWLTKGRKVFIRGELSSKVFTPDNAEPQVSLSIMCDKITLLDSSRQHDQSSLETAPEPANFEPPLHDDQNADDLPF